MFHQVRCAPEDRDRLRFLWWPQGEVSKEPLPYQMTVHLFGAKSLPSCAAFALLETAKQFGKNYGVHVIEIVKKSFMSTIV